jgi:hypothetical protein
MQVSSEPTGRAMKVVWDVRIVERTDRGFRVERFDNPGKRQFLRHADAFPMSPEWPTPNQRTAIQCVEPIAIELNVIL